MASIRVRSSNSLIQRKFKFNSVLRTTLLRTSSLLTASYGNHSSLALAFAKKTQEFSSFFSTSPASFLLIMLVPFFSLLFFLLIYLITTNWKFNGRMGIDDVKRKIEFFFLSSSILCCVRRFGRSKTFAFFLFC